MSGLQQCNFTWLNFQTMKKKFFVLREDSVEASARLEYYDSEKKFRTHQPAKRQVKSVSTYLVYLD